MNNISGKIKQLNTLLETSDMFNDIFTLFMDIAETTDFRAKGVLCEDNDTKELIGAMVKQVFSLPMKNLTLVKVNDYELLHGSFFIEQNLAILFFFEGINKGMVAVNTGQGNIQYLRFSFTKGSKHQFVVDTSSDSIH